jgi:predicted HTH domain antitoxin
MKTFTVHDLQTRPADLIDHAKSGESSWITHQGKPVVMAVSCDLDLTDTRMATALAIGLFVQEAISLGRAAQLARMSRSQFADHLASLDIPVLRISASELARDLALFDRSSP